MTNLKKIQLFIVVNDFKVVVLVNSETTRNVISFEFLTKNEVKTERKRLASDLYEFNEKRIKEKMNRKVTTQVKTMSRELFVIFDVMNCAKNVLLKYSWFKDYNFIVN